MPATLRHEIARKGIHLASSAIPIAYAAGLPHAVLVPALGAAGVAAAAIEVARTRSPRARDTFERLVGPLLRPHERGRWSGATWMCAAYLIVVIVFPRPEAVAAMLAVSFGDAAAAVIGRVASARARARRAEGADARAAGRKTWIGSLACLSATMTGALVVARLDVAAAFACGAAAMLAERPRWAVDDNVRVALAAGAAAWAVARLGGG
ncbi:MAG TPA: hypothetical protein VGD56_04590 [Gemmatirosa sp.]